MVWSHFGFNWFLKCFRVPVTAPLSNLAKGGGGLKMKVCSQSFFICFVICNGEKNSVSFLPNASILTSGLRVLDPSGYICWKIWIIEGIWLNFVPFFKLFSTFRTLFCLWEYIVCHHIYHMSVLDNKEKERRRKTANEPALEHWAYTDKPWPFFTSARHHPPTYLLFSCHTFKESLKKLSLWKDSQSSCQLFSVL